MEIIYYMVLIVLITIILLYLFYKLYFLRNPKRIIPLTKHILSPADGKIVKIINFNNDKIEDRDKNKKKINIRKKIYSKIETLCSDIAEQCYVIVIVMNLFDVHYQRSPINGVVKNVDYTPGKFKNAVINAAALKTLDNEKNEFVLSNNKIKIKVIQVAGILARRIKCFVKKGEKVFKGKLVGLVCLGSQVIIILPKNRVVLKVEEKQKVKAGKTIIAEYKR